LQPPGVCEKEVDSGVGKPFGVCSEAAEAEMHDGFMVGFSVFGNEVLEPIRLLARGAGECVLEPEKKLVIEVRGQPAVVAE
jgi:hypothetical protein